MIDADPSLAKRSALAAPLVHMPVPFIVDHLAGRLQGDGETIDLDDDAVAIRANAYLKLCTDNREARVALAARILDDHTGGHKGKGKRMLANARKLVPSPLPS
jgi:hypothetical protein